MFRTKNKKVGDVSGGFGIPSDYNPAPANPDVVLEEHNQIVAETVKNFQETLAAIPADLAEHTIVRRAFEIKDLYNQVNSQINEYNNNVSNLNNACSEIANYLQSILSEIREKAAYWLSVNNRNTLLTNYFSAITSNIQGIEQRNNCDISILMPNLYETLNKMSTYDSNDFSEASDWQLYLQVLENCFETCDLFVNADKKVLSEDNIYTLLKQRENLIGEIAKTSNELKTAFHTVSEENVKAILSEVPSHVKELWHKGLLTLENLKEISMKSRTKNNLRLLQEVTTPETKNDGVPTNITNYRVAIDASPRICGNCRFFVPGDNPNTGHCSAFDFEARPNYVCDAWQSQTLSAYHTAVRAQMEYVDGTPKETRGNVLANQSTLTPDSELMIETEEEVNINAETEPDDNAAIRYFSKDFVPGDLVYSKALRSYAYIESSSVYNGNKVFSLKLIDKRGVAWGTSVSHVDDLEPRSSKAFKIKGNSSNKSIKESVVTASDIELNEIVTSTKELYKIMKQAVDTHADVTLNPLSNKEVLSPLRDTLLATLEKPAFVAITTGPKRKYYRAIQTALSSIGAARQVLFEGYKAINVLKQKGTKNADNQIKMVMIKSQTDAYDRLTHAAKQLEDALLLPSVTHDMPAPGI